VEIVHAGIADVAERPIGSVITVRGKELARGATVAEARAIFASGSVQLVPVLDAGAYVGALSRDDLRDAADADPVERYAVSTPPTAYASATVEEALPELDEDGGRRLVVLGDDGATYVGLVCLTSDRAHLCIDAECHAAAARTGA
jgi:CBS domain-containing protein